jgi:hypothetical protein
MKNLAVFLMALGMMFLFTTATSLAGINDGLVAYYPFNGNANDESREWERWDCEWGYFE